MWKSAHGFKDFKEEFDFKVRSRWRRPSIVTDLLEDSIPSTDTIVAIVIPDNDMKGGLESSVSVHHTSPYQSTMALCNHDYVPTTNGIVSMKIGSAGNMLKYDSGLSMDQAANYHTSAAVSTTKFTSNFAVKTSSNVVSSLTQYKKSHILTTRTVILHL